MKFKTKQTKFISENLLFEIRKNHLFHTDGAFKVLFNRHIERKHLITQIYAYNDQNELVGVLFVEHYEFHPTKVHQWLGVYVDKIHRGKGICHQLLMRFDRYMRRKNWQVKDLFVYDKNIRYTKTVFSYMNPIPCESYHPLWEFDEVVDVD